MHKHTIDWLRQVHLSCDSSLAEKRWKIAETVSSKLTRKRLIELLRVFLFPNVNVEFAKQFTDELVQLDPEFTITGNTQDLRLMAGFVMIVLFEGRTYSADAFALGLKCADFPKARTTPAQPQMVEVAEEYLQNEAIRLRPNEFVSNEASVTKEIAAAAKAVTEADDDDKSEVAQEAFRQSVIKTIDENHVELAWRIERLAEESGLLWWVFNGYSDTLEKSVEDLNRPSYALVAAAEAAEHTRLLPPPPCIAPLLARALVNCKPGKKEPVLLDFLKASDSKWRSRFVQSLAIAECRDLVPVAAAIEKMEELGDVETAFKAMSKLCPGVTADLRLSPAQVALQLYNEIIFLRALAHVQPE